MSDSCPELVFLTGPQQGRHLPIIGAPAVAGRGGDVQIALAENYVSRRQMQFQQTPDGWIVENLSTNGTIINNRRFKVGKQVILETGDVIEVGLQTKILFVNTGDSVYEAVKAYNEENQADQPALKKTPRDEVPPSDQTPPPPTSKFAPKSKADHVELKTASVLTEDEEKLLAKKAKYKKYAIFFGVYLLAMVVLVLFLATRDGQSGPSENSLPERLTDADIEGAIEALPDLSPNSMAAKVALDNALALYSNNPWYQTGGLYECVKQFKLYRAYKGGVGFDRIEDETKYLEVLRNGRKITEGGAGGQEGLVVKVKREYNKAWEFENSSRWREAMESLVNIIALIPEQDNQDPTYELLLTNVFKHRSYVKARLPSKKRQK